MRCKNVTSKRGVYRYDLLAFTEQGVALLSSILKSDHAANVNVSIMRVFVAMRGALASVAPLLTRMDTIERRQITDQSRTEERFDLRRLFVREEAGAQGGEENPCLSMAIATR